MITSASSRRAPAETKAYLTRSFNGFHGSDIYTENQMRGGAGGGGGMGSDVINRRQTPALHDPWNEDIVSSARTDGQRSLKYIHTTNYPNKLLMRRAKSVASLYSLNGILNDSPRNCPTGRCNGATSTTSDLRSPKVMLRTTVDRQTQTTCDRYTQTPVVLAPDSYYQELLSTLISRRSSSAADFSPMVKPGDVRHLQSFVMKHGPAVNRYGGKGAPWRHLKRTCGISGENIMFVDGEVKEYDSRFFPTPSATRRELDMPEIYYRRSPSVIQY